MDVLIVSEDANLAVRLSTIVEDSGWSYERPFHIPSEPRCSAWVVAGALSHVLRVLERTHDAPHPPVFALVEGGVDERVAALRAGAHDVLSLPFDDAELAARLTRTLAHADELGLLLGENARLHALSTTDPLTGLANRRQYEVRLAQEFRRAQRYDAPLALILFDIDHFKQVNDLYGHPVGDVVLREVATCALKSVRDTDFLARIGGEEFAVVLPQTHLAGSITVAERLRNDIARLKLDGVESRISVSAGLSGLPWPGLVQVEGLVRAADAALYRAKREGRDRVCLASAESLPAARAAVV